MGVNIMKSQDIFILLKLVSIAQQAGLYNVRKEDLDVGDKQAGQGWKIEDRPVNLVVGHSALADACSCRGLEASTGVSKSEVNASINRSIAIGMAKLDRKSKLPKVNVSALLEFIVHGIKYVFPANPSAIVRGIPTSFAAPVLKGKIMTAGEFICVWPDAEGSEKGQSVQPLYKTVPMAVKKDPRLYSFLALIDAIRGGGARESEIAKKELAIRLMLVNGLEVNNLMKDNDNHVIDGTLVVPREALKKLARRYHIKRLALFGSAARGELMPHSDIDLLVEFESGSAPSLGGMVKLQDDFVHLFGGRKVDVATSSILNNPYRRRTIERDMKEIYAA